MSDSEDDSALYLHAWRDTTADWWVTATEATEDNQIRVNYISGDRHEITTAARFRNYTYAGRIWATELHGRVLQLHGRRDCQLDLILQMITHMGCSLAAEEVPCGTASVRGSPEALCCPGPSPHSMHMHKARPEIVAVVFRRAGSCWRPPEDDGGLQIDASEFSCLPNAPSTQ